MAVQMGQLHRTLLYCFYYLQAQTLHFILEEAELLHVHLVHEVHQVDLAVLKYQEHRILGNSHHHLPQRNDVRMVAQLLQHFNFA